MIPFHVKLLDCAAGVFAEFYGLYYDLFQYQIPKTFSGKLQFEICFELFLLCITIFRVLICNPFHVTSTLPMDKGEN